VLVVVPLDRGRGGAGVYGMDIVDLAKEIEASLVLAIAFEPPELLAERVFGLDDVALRWVVSLTLAHIQVTRAIEISLLLTTDDELHELNRSQPRMTGRKTTWATRLN
jgi:hypothetical protein